jgi:hypothetical protein
MIGCLMPYILHFIMRYFHEIYRMSAYYEFHVCPSVSKSKYSVSELLHVFL